MTIDYAVPPLAWDEDGIRAPLDVVTLEQGGVEIRFDGRDEPVVTLRTTDDIERLMKLLEQAGDRWREMHCLTSPVVVSVHEPSGSIEVQSGILAVRRIPDDRGMVNGRPLFDRRLKYYAWSDEKHRQLVGVPNGMSLRQVADQSQRSIWMSRALPRLYRALLAAEREAAVTE